MYVVYNIYIFTVIIVIVIISIITVFCLCDLQLTHCTAFNRIISVHVYCSLSLAPSGWSILPIKSVLNLYERIFATDSDLLNVAITHKMDS